MAFVLQITVSSVANSRFHHNERTYLMMFRKMLVLLPLLAAMPLVVNATQISFKEVTGEGTFYIGPSSIPSNKITDNDFSLLTDGVFPGEWSTWNLYSTINFNQWGSTYDREYITFDMGSLFLIDEMSISVDNNDSYTIEYSTDKSSWLNLTTVDLGYGEVSNGMDTMTSILGDTEYISGLDFAQSGPAQYLRIYVDGWQGVGPTSNPDVGDGAYALGEFQVFGEAYVDPSGGSNPVPEPSTVLLLGSGLAGLAWYGRKRKKA